MLPLIIVVFKYKGVFLLLKLHLQTRSNYLYYSGAQKKNLSFGVYVISNKIYIDTRNQYAVDASYKLKLLSV
jgi:hypothetical protein